MRTGPLLILPFAVACAGDPAGPAADPPIIDAASVAPNEHNVLSAVVFARVRSADSVAVRYRLDAASGDSSTAAVRVTRDSASIPVLGLMPASRYVLRVVAYGAGGTSTGGFLSFTTDTLPTDLPRYTTSGSDPSPGYVAFAAGPYGLVIDNTGRVVWYRRMPNGAGLNFIAQSSGHFFLRPPTSNPFDIEPWLELDVLGRITRTLTCARGLQPRLHDLIVERNDSYWLMCDETRTMDLSEVGGVAGARVTGTAIQHIGADGELLFHWSPFDHFAITDVQLSERTGPNVNWTHGNAIDFDRDGSLLVSFRNLGEITKIDVATGAVRWRLGGRANQFAFENTATPAFVGQHSARALATGTLVLLDNIGNPIESRVERYAIDERARTARLVHSYGAAPSALTLIGGSVQALDNERTLVSFGTAGRVEEYDAAGRVVWRITGNAGYVFRAQRIPSLYAPGLTTVANR
ncbi:MAG TPA: aryl-sulfate sulfotransferase [Gemmatimonadaceae bacterium]|nr:aryl-sulfate sulfotransferase [Gemmatimonadaceae bacterium]